MRYQVDARHAVERPRQSSRLAVLRAVGCGVGFLLSLTFVHIWLGGH